MERTNLTAEAADAVLDAEASGRITTIRKQRNISIRVLAAGAGMSKRTLDRRLKEGGWYLHELRAISNHLGVSIGDLTAN